MEAYVIGSVHVPNNNRLVGGVIRNVPSTSAGTSSYLSNEQCEPPGIKAFPLQGSVSAATP